MTNKIYVGNLSYTASEEELKDLFEQHGAVVSVKIITDKFSGKSKGFGFVEMDGADKASAAVEALNGVNFKGRNLRVSEARERA